MISLFVYQTWLPFIVAVVIGVFAFISIAILNRAFFKYHFVLALLWLSFALWNAHVRSEIRDAIRLDAMIFVPLLLLLTAISIVFLCVSIGAASEKR